MTTVNIRGVPVTFPFEPYDIQKDYMGKVIECLQNETNAVLESPTGTGKTLSLLCSSLAWLTIKKAQVQAHQLCPEDDSYVSSLRADLDNNVGVALNNGKQFLGFPTIIYSSRTHSQLSQAMQELKRTSYNHMKSTVIGSREQMCINPKVASETNQSTKIHMCRIKVQTRSCRYYNRVEKKKDDPMICEQNVLDIEDLVKIGQTHKVCPYYLSKELKQQADIVFMPYNYLLDPKSRKALGIQLSNNIVILDEAHNIERICEDSASLQIKTTDISMGIEEVTEVMKIVSEEISSFNSDTPKDFTADELCILKQMLLDFEKAVDEIDVKNVTEGSSYDGNFIFDILGKANINDTNFHLIIDLTDKIISFLSTASEGPFNRKGNSLQLFQDLLRIVFASSGVAFKQKIQKCYKVHITIEESRKKKADMWLSKPSLDVKKGCRLLSFWCFSSGFGMNMLMDQGVRSVILTSGTLAPLKPFISELELNIQVQLENPHIINQNQICVKIISAGPDMEPLNCNYQNRSNPKYIYSLGRSIANLSKIIPNGLLIFFPSYPILEKCKEQWEKDGILSTINEQKAIFVEPKQKDAFHTAITEYYERIKNPNFKGAIFMGVCRGKVAEGLDFADYNGRAVIIVGLPYPPLKDPRIILKKQYLDACHAKNKDFLLGNEWYNLEATRAVNQAIGRIIRHKYDYGAILLLDSRFNNQTIKSQLSLWLRNQIKPVNNFGEVIRDLRNFYKNAEANLPRPSMRNEKPVYSSQPCSSASSEASAYTKGLFNFSDTSTARSFGEAHHSGLVNIHKRTTSKPLKDTFKRKKITLIPNRSLNLTSEPTVSDIKEYIVMVKKALNAADFQLFVKAISLYRDSSNFTALAESLDSIFLSKPNLVYIIQGLSTYIKDHHKEDFQFYWEKIR